LKRKYSNRKKKEKAIEIMILSNDAYRAVVDVAAHVSAPIGDHAHSTMTVKTIIIETRSTKRRKCKNKIKV
jgi:hypothetical protein